MNEQKIRKWCRKCLQNEHAQYCTKCHVLTCNEILRDLFFESCSMSRIKAGNMVVCVRANSSVFSFGTVLVAPKNHKDNRSFLVQNMLHLCLHKATSARHFDNAKKITETQYNILCCLANWRKTEKELQDLQKLQDIVFKKWHEK